MDHIPVFIFFVGVIFFASSVQHTRGLQCYCAEDPGFNPQCMFGTRRCEGMDNNIICMTEFIEELNGRVTRRSSCLNKNINPNWEERCSGSMNSNTFNRRCCDSSDQCNRRFHFSNPASILTTSSVSMMATTEEPTMPYAFSPETSTIISTHSPPKETTIMPTMSADTGPLTTSTTFSSSTTPSTPPSSPSPTTPPSSPLPTPPPSSPPPITPPPSSPSLTTRSAISDPPHTITSRIFSSSSSSTKSSIEPFSSAIQNFFSTSPSSETFSETDLSIAVAGTFVITFILTAILFLSIAFACCQYRKRIRIGNSSTKETVAVEDYKPTVDSEMAIV